jgi:hypothetical protein
MSFSIRRAVSAAAIAVSVVGAVAVSAPAAQAAGGPSVLWYPTNNVWTDANATAECRAMGQQEVASGNWDAFSCRVDMPVGPSAIQLWVGIWVGCPTCVTTNGKQ